MFIRTDIPKKDIVVVLSCYVVANIISVVISALIMRWMR
jgi:hypothetical protein